jgi:hypothetical protein
MTIFCLGLYIVHYYFMHSGYPVMAVTFCLSCSICSVLNAECVLLAVLPLLPYPSSFVLATMSWLSCPGSLVLALLFCLSGSALSISACLV